MEKFRSLAVKAIGFEKAGAIESAMSGSGDLRVRKLMALLG